MFRKYAIISLVLLICPRGQAQQDTNRQKNGHPVCELLLPNKIIVCNTYEGVDTIQLSNRFQTEIPPRFFTSEQHLIFVLDNNMIAQYSFEKKTWENLTVSNYTAHRSTEIKSKGNSVPSENPFSNKILTPIYFLLGSSFIYGLIRLILLKYEYDTKLNLEKLEREKLEEINLVKVNFYNMISHELKTPLTLIIGPIQELKQNLNTPKNKILIEYVDKNAKKLKTLIDEILNYKNHEFEYFDVKLKSISFNEFVEEICLNFKDNAARKTITIDLKSSLSQSYTYFDSKLMELVINNLIVNALKFSPINKKIEITIWGDDEYIYFKIRDYGSGILAKELPYVFNKYYQGSNNINGGSGIGLALAKEIIEKHKGSISVESKYRKGTTFTFKFLKNLNEILPQYVNDGDSMLKQIAEIQVQESKEKEKENTILIVDDNDDIRAYLTLRLQKSYKILLADDGDLGYKKAIEHVPNIIVSDLAMPIMDGMTMCKMIKTNPITNHIPIILLTARARIKYLGKSLENGADAYITKPFDIDVLEQKIANILSQTAKIQKKVLAQISMDINSPEIVEVTNDFVTKFIFEIRDNLENLQFSTDYIAGKLNLSSSQCYRKIKSLTGLSPNQIIQRVRLEEACKLLLESEYTIVQIINKVGMNDPKYFRKIFKEKYQTTPSNFRKTRITDKL